MKKVLVLALFSAAIWGCGDRPVEGNNPAAANGVKAPSDTMDGKQKMMESHMPGKGGLRR